MAIEMPHAPNTTTKTYATHVRKQMPIQIDMYAHTNLNKHYCCQAAITK